MSKLKTFLIDLVIIAVLGLALVILLDAASHVFRHAALSLAEQITAAGWGEA